MSTTAPDTPPPEDEDLLTSLFAELGIPRLVDILDAGELEESDRDWDQLAIYCKVAAVRWSGRRAGTVERLADLCVWRLSTIISGDGPDYCEIDGEPALRTDAGPRLVTERTLSHWEWMLTIATDESVARRLLEQAPAEVRGRADAAVAEGFAEDFAQIVAGLAESGDSQ